MNLFGTSFFPHFRSSVGPHGMSHYFAPEEMDDGILGRTDVADFLCEKQVDIKAVAGRCSRHFFVQNIF